MLPVASGLNNMVSLTAVNSEIVPVPINEETSNNLKLVDKLASKRITVEVNIMSNLGPEKV